MAPGEFGFSDKLEEVSYCTAAGDAVPGSSCKFSRDADNASIRKDHTYCSEMPKEEDHHGEETGRDPGPSNLVVTNYSHPLPLITAISK